MGKILYEMRKKQKISAREVIEGICPLSSYSQYESGEKTPDFLTVNAILERLGQGLSGLSAWLCAEEISYVKWRDQVFHAIRNKNYHRLNQLVNKEVVRCSSFNKKLQEQFLYYAKGIVEEKLYQNFMKARESYGKALALTAPFLVNEEKEMKKIGKFEMLIYSLYARLSANQNSHQQQLMVRRLEQLCSYSLSMPDIEERVKCFPHLVCILLEIDNDFEENIEKLEQHEKLLEEAYQQLKECRYLYHIIRLLELLISCKNKLMKDTDKLQREQRSIKDLFLLLGKSVEYDPYEITGSSWMMVAVGEYLEQGRRKKGITQEEISENICEPENYSRIEKGKRKPRNGRYKALAHKVELEPKYYEEMVVSGKESTYWLRQEISREIFEENYEKAEALLKKLESEMGKELERNRQYLEERYALIKYKLNQAEDEERILDLIRILSYSLKLEEIGQNIHTYNGNEINLINQLAVMYQKTKRYEEAISLLDNFIKDMLAHEWEISQRFEETYLAALNLNKNLTNLSQFEEGNQICFRWLKRAVDIGYAEQIDEYLVEISYNFEQRNTEGADIPRKLCKLSVELSNIYGTKRSRKLIRAYYEKTYGE